MSSTPGGTGVHVIPVEQVLTANLAALLRSGQVHAARRSVDATAARHPEDAAGVDLSAPEKRRQVGGQYLFDRNHVDAGAAGLPGPYVHEAGRDRRNLDHGEAPMALVVGDQRDDVDREIGGRGPRTFRRDDEWREHRDDVVAEHGGRRRPLEVPELTPFAQLQSHLRKRLPQVRQRRALPVEQRVGVISNGLVVVPGQLKELVDKAADIGQDPQPFRRCGGVVLRQREPPAGAIETAGVLVKVPGLLDICDRALCRNRGLHGHRPKVRRRS
jgi:hypothetical protein